VKLLFLALALAGAAAFGADSPKTNALAPKASRVESGLSGAATNDPVQAEYRRVLEADDDAQDEVDRWISETQTFANKGVGDPRGTLKNRIRQRLEPVDKAYKDFILHHPDHVAIRLAYGSFLNDTGSEDEAVAQWEKARELDPKNPAPYNNLAPIYGSKGQMDKAFEYFEKAIELKPGEAVYCQNLADHITIFRQAATNYYHLTEPQAFEKALELYRKSMNLAPTNFVFATEYARSFYAAPSPRLKEALAAWESAFKLASDKLQRDGILVHLARIKIGLGRLDEARKDLDGITDARFDDVKATLCRSLTNTVPAAVLTQTNSAR
jgi:tetratricopeptide (TPR) repeat protein